MDIRQSSLPSNNFQPATSQSKQVDAVSASNLASANLASISSVSTIPSSSAASSTSLAANVALTTAKPIAKSTVTPTAAAVSQNVSPVLTPTAVKTASFANVSPINTSSAAANQNPSVPPTNSPSTISSNGFNLRTGATHIAAINPAQIAKPEVSQTSAVSVDAIQAVNIFATAEPSETEPSETEPTDTKTDYQQLFQQQTQTEPNVDVEKERINPFEDKTPPSEINTEFSQNAVSQSAVNQDANNRQQDAQVNGQAEQASTSEQAIAAEQQKQQQQAQEQQQQQQQASDQAEQQQQKVALAEQQIISELSKRDIEVKTHEQAHKAVGGMFAQSPSFSYEKGPDGKRYAVDGEVQIDVGAVSGDPQATFNKMQKVYAAAMAPNQPSSADIRVAAEAVQKMNQAKAEMAELRQEKIIPAEDIQHINELANTYKQADAQQNGFQQSQLAPFTLAEKNTATADAKSRFSQKMAESQDTRTPQVPLATLAYLQNQAVPNTSSTNSFMYDKSDQALAFSV
ncbi:putative metalloprotease CJM1_0395 family protein [Shewanella sp. HL-SH4]|uniref:putative metalloprotease CJM1_0395 family protein n=1 Tax=Shewanella sp. HL-SH4 TaxID=3436240 RepID=UPI003EB87A85